MDMTEAKFPVDFTGSVSELYNFIQAFNAAKRPGQNSATVLQNMINSEPSVEKQKLLRSKFKMLKDMKFIKENESCTAAEFIAKVNETKQKVAEDKIDAQNKYDAAHKDVEKETQNAAVARRGLFFGRLRKWGSVVVAVLGVAAALFAAPAILGMIASAVAIGGAASAFGAVAAALVSAGAVAGAYGLSKYVISKNYNAGVKAIAGAKEQLEAAKEKLSGKDKLLEKESAAAAALERQTTFESVLDEFQVQVVSEAAAPDAAEEEARRKAEEEARKKAEEEAKKAKEAEEAAEEDGTGNLKGVDIKKAFEDLKKNSARQELIYGLGRDKKREEKYSTLPEETRDEARKQVKKIVEQITEERVEEQSKEYIRNKLREEKTKRRAEANAAPLRISGHVATAEELKEIEEAKASEVAVKPVNEVAEQKTDSEPLSEAEMYSSKAKQEAKARYDKAVKEFNKKKDNGNAASVLSDKYKEVEAALKAIKKAYSKNAGISAWAKEQEAIVAEMGAYVGSKRTPKPEEAISENAVISESEASSTESPVEKPKVEKLANTPEGKVAIKKAEEEEQKKREEREKKFGGKGKGASAGKGAEDSKEKESK